MPRPPRSCSRFARALVYRAGPAYPPVLQAKAASFVDVLLNEQQKKP